jgi:hypothetical protein
VSRCLFLSARRIPPVADRAGGGAGRIRERRGLPSGGRQDHRRGRGRAVLHDGLGDQPLRSARHVHVPVPETGAGEYVADLLHRFARGRPDESLRERRRDETQPDVGHRRGADHRDRTGPRLGADLQSAPGADLGDTEGLFFAAVPQSFSIHAGESASIQGVNQGDGENFRYNFALVETGGSATTVNVQVLDGAGVLLGQQAFLLSAYEQLQPNVGDIVPAIATTNARITATVTSGSGAVLLAGAQLANVSQDSSGFEMSFKGSLLGGGGGTVVHNATLTGDGTAGSPLGLAIPLTLTSGLLKFQIFPSAAIAFYAQSDETSNSGVAIWGQGRSIGVYGEMVDGSHDTVAWGELGRSAGGQSYGVVAGSFDPNGSAMLAQYVGTPPGTALELQNGALKVSGVNPTAFVHVATADTLDGVYVTVITNPLTDGDPNAILIVTHNYNPAGVSGNYLTSPYSVYYNGTHWAIYLDDFGAILNKSFNVLVIKR